MKNLLKKFGVMIASIMLAMTTFVMPSFAAEDTHVTINGVEEGATVMAYQVVKDVDGKWTLVKDSVPIGDTDASKGLVKGIKTTKVAGSDKTEVVPTAEKVAQIADNPSVLGAGVRLEWDKDSKNYKSSTEDGKKLDKGVYVVVVTGTSNTIYNPMVVSMDYDNSNNSASVSAGSDFVVGETTAYAKKSTPDVKKTTLDNQNRYENTQNKNPFTTSYDAGHPAANDRNVGTDMAGSILPFKVVTKIPSYAQTFTNPKFYFTDTLNTGFDGYVVDSKNTLTVMEATTGGAYKTLTLGTDYWFVDAEKNKLADASQVANYINEKQTFSIEFDVENDKPARDICITYGAKMVDVYDDEGKLKEEYQAGVDPYTNDVKIEWSKNPSKEDEFGTAEDCTHHYTFDIDGSIGGQKNGKEIIKVAVDDAGNLITAEKELKGNWTPLAKAEFAIFKANDAMNEKVGKAIQTVETEADGTMDFKGLDAGKYVIQETKAPDGYALNDTLIPVEIVASFKAIEHHGKTCHVIDKYTVTVNKKYTNTYTAVYNDDGELTGVTKSNNEATIQRLNERPADLAVQDTEDFTAGFVNTKTGTLPSTGGMGTILFTIGGIVLIGLAFLLLFGGRRRQHQK